MRGIVKTVNRFDSLWTAFLLVPGVCLFMNTAIAMHNGQGSSLDMTRAGVSIAQTAIGQYTPYVKTTGNFIASGVTKMLKTGIGCAKSHGPIYLSPGMVQNNGCGLGNSLTASMSKSYSVYH